MTDITYPYTPFDDPFETVSVDSPHDIDNVYMARAREIALTDPQDMKQTVGTVIVRDNEIIGEGQNGSGYHEKNADRWEDGCYRKENDIPSGQGYEDCPGCHPTNHAEPTAILDALDLETADKEPTELYAEIKTDEYVDALSGAELYMWGHWWACEPCWDVMDHVGIETVYLLEDHQRWFDRDSDEYLFDDGVQSMLEDIPDN